MDLVISDKLLSKLRDKECTLLQNMKKVNNQTFTAIEFYNRMVNDLNSKYPNFHLNHITSLDDIKTQKISTFIAQVKDHNQTIADIVIANAYKPGNTFIYQQLMGYVISVIYDNREYLTNNVIKIVYSTFDRSHFDKAQKNLPSSMNMAFRGVKTIGFHIVEMFPNEKDLPPAFKYVFEVIRSYNAGRKDSNKSSSLGITSNKLPSDTLTLTVNAKNAKGSSEYYYELMLLAIYRLNGPVLKYDFKNDSLSSNAIKLLDIFNNRPKTNNISSATTDVKNNQHHDVHNIPDGYGKNEIHYGAPGTGKSFSVNEKYKNSTNTMRRVTFYPDYDYSDFVGGLRPVRVHDTIDYRYVGGPLLWTIIQALDNPSQEVTLIIEEINRAEAASVFGDTFQLLDRDSVTAISTYAISNKEMARFIDSHTKFNYDLSTRGIRLPGNLNIIATMNSADQGVYPLDTAFKRRWHMHYHPINWKYSAQNKYPLATIPGFNKSWEDVGNIINTMLIKIDTNEDALLGQFFFDEDELSSSNNIEYISSKLFGYLWNDVARYKRDDLFKAHTLSQLIQDYRYCCANKLSFNDTIHKLFTDNISSTVDESNEN